MAFLGVLVKALRLVATCWRAVVLTGLSVGSCLAVDVWRVAETDRAGQVTVYNRTAFGSDLGMPVVMGDVNRDGFSDAILTPMDADSGPGRSRDAAGEIGVVLSTGTISGEIDLASFDPLDLPPNVTLIYGRDERDLLGTETDAADLDGDGYDDIIAGTQLGDGPGNARPGCGEVAIIWGGPDFGGRVIDTAIPGDDVTFVYGVDDGDRLGVWVFSGDLDGDGTMDAVLGADQGNGPDNERFHVGETYVLYGGAHLRGMREIDLADTTAPLTVVYGIDDEDHSGATVRAGDLDNDGTDELLIGAGLNRLSASVGNLPGAGGHGSRGGDGPDNLRSNAGEAYVLYLGKGARPSSIDLRTPPSSMVVIYGADNRDAYGEELFAGDFNGDGFGDLAVGAIAGDSIDNVRRDGGDLALVLGGDDLPGSVIDLRFGPPNVTFFYGQAAGAIAGDTALFADLDNDGYDELVIASPNAPVDGLPRVGTTHVFFGTEDPLPAVVDLGAIPDELSVVQVEGSDVFDMLAYSMAFGDADADGFTDLMLNVMDGDGIDNLLPSSGDAHILSGAELSRLAGKVVAMPTATPTPPTCVGDCDGDGEVTIAELIRAVRQLLLPVTGLSCPAVDGNGDGFVTVNELIQAVNNALNGC